MQPVLQPQVTPQCWCWMSCMDGGAWLGGRAQDKGSGGWEAGVGSASRSSLLQRHKLGRVGEGEDAMQGRKWQGSRQRCCAAVGEGGQGAGKRQKSRDENRGAEIGF